MLKKTNLFIDSHHIQFGLFSEKEMVQISELQVTSRGIHLHRDRTPQPNGCLDTRLVRSSQQELA
jgi:hypothetical protein